MFGRGLRLWDDRLGLQFDSRLGFGRFFDWSGCWGVVGFG